MEQITPELEHRIQVEELWARRGVLADAINAARRERFYAQHKLLARFGTAGFSMPAPTAAEAAPDIVVDDIPPIPAHASQTLKPFAPVMEDERPIRRRVIAWTGAAALAAAVALVAVNLPVDAMMSFARGQLHAYGPRLMQMMPHHAAAAPARPVQVAQPRTAPDLRAEVAAEIAAARDRQIHSADTLAALQSDMGGR